MMPTIWQLVKHIALENYQHNHVLLSEESALIYQLILVITATVGIYFHLIHRGALWVWFAKMRNSGTNFLLEISVPWPRILSWEWHGSQLFLCSISLTSIHLSYCSADCQAMKAIIYGTELTTLKLVGSSLSGVGMPLTSLRSHVLIYILPMGVPASCKTLVFQISWLFGVRALLLYFFKSD